MTRERLTITLKQEIISLLDNYIDGSKIRNRSHAIEYLLSKQLAPSSVKVVILAGGQGIELRPITYEMPKSLIPIHEKPLLEHTLNLLNKNNLRDIIICIGYLGEKIKEYFKDGSKMGVDISYSSDKKNNQGTVAPLLKIKDSIGSKNFFVIHGDVLADIDYLDFLEFHKQNDSIATMALTSVASPSQWGVAYMQGNKIIKFQEKPLKEKVSSHLINAGIYLFKPEIFDYLDKNQKTLSLDVLPKLAQENQLNGYLFEGQWHDVGSSKAYEKALKEWKF